MSLPLLKGTITLEDALKEDEDVVQQLSYPEKRLEFWLRLYRSRDQIIEVVSRHLNIPPSDIRLAEVEDWIHGSFNACIPIRIFKNARTSNLPRQVIIRFPLPYKIGEMYRPGNVDEKLRTEAATYIWLQSNCPNIPVPRLFGFGFPGTQSFTALENESFYNRIFWYLRCGISLVSGYKLSPYFSHQRQSLLDLGYLVIEHVDEGRILSESWEKHRHDLSRRTNLYRDLARIMLSLAKLPLPRIGSWTIDNQGVITLTNRPLTFPLHQQENLQIPTNIPRNLTYSCVEPYLLDLIACQDNRIRFQPNSIHHEADGEAQLASLTAMRALLPRFTNRHLREGPFVLSLTDFHQSNIFVDDEWNITRIIDLEWACVRPLEMIGPPSWLSGKSLEELAFSLDEYTALHTEFVDIFEEEELARYGSNACTRVLRVCWKTGSFWYSQAMDSPSTLLALYLDHLQPRFMKLRKESQEEFDRILTPLWGLGTAGFLSSKLAEQERYSHRIREIFEASPACSPDKTAADDKEQM